VTDAIWAAAGIRMSALVASPVDGQGCRMSERAEAERGGWPRSGCGSGWPSRGAGNRRTGWRSWRGVASDGGQHRARRPSDRGDWLCQAGADPRYVPGCGCWLVRRERARGWWLIAWRGCLRSCRSFGRVVAVKPGACATAERLGLDRCRAAVKRIGGGEGRPGGETTSRRKEGSCRRRYGHDRAERVAPGRSGKESPGGRADARVNKTGTGTQRRPWASRRCLIGR
jgi:hypothetical protein